MKVLLSAYACEPGKGSEPEVGWQWAMQMAQHHEITVLTRANNQGAIEAELARTQPNSAPQFVYLDLNPLALKLKRRLRLHKTYYALWQRKARQVISEMTARNRFDLLHHATYAGARYGAAVMGHSIPALIGPVGGLESIPPQLLPWEHPAALAEEIARNASNAWQSAAGLLRRNMAQAKLVLASTRETEAALRRLGIPTRLMPTIGLHVSEFPLRDDVGRGALRLLYTGRVLYWKGVELAIRALQAAGGDATLTVIGEGEFMPAALTLARKLDVAGRVDFRGRLERSKTLESYRDFDVFLYPSLHDSGGFTLIEAMASGLPAICLDCGGPGLAVDLDCGFKISLGSRSEVVRELANAIRSYDSDRTLCGRHGRNARSRIAAAYDWPRKAEAMSAVYQELAGG